MQCGCKPKSTTYNAGGSGQFAVVDTAQVDASACQFAELERRNQVLVAYIEKALELVREDMDTLAEMTLRAALEDSSS